MSDFYSSKFQIEINSDNYLVNCYKSIAKTKAIHFLFILIEIFMNFFQEIELDLKNVSSDEIKLDLNYIRKITIAFDKISMIVKLIVIIVYILVFDAIYIILRIQKFKKKYIIVSILINILELFHFRIFSLIFFNLFFTLPNIYFIISCIFVVPHLCLIIHHFLYNHLYYYVPKFINYPYDEFSSLFDLILLYMKIFLSIARNTNSVGIEQCCSFIFHTSQILFCFYFIIKLKNHSYLFMKNQFLNKTKFSFFFAKTIISILTLILGKIEIINILFIILSIGIIFIVLTYVYFIYEPLHYIKINKETPMENIYFYLYILSEKDDLNFLVEYKINEHYKRCGVCDLCKKYIYYLDNHQSNIEIEEDEKKNLINEGNKSITPIIMMQLFDILYNKQNKYFQLMEKITISYKLKGKEIFNNNSYYYINLSFLIFSDYQNNNITLSLNEKLILEMFNKENKLLDNHEFQINQILLCNKFISLGNNILNKLKEILNSEQNIDKAKKLIDLSFLLKDMKKPIYKKNLFSHKQDNISNSKNLIMACSILYEEIFNITINNSQIPIRDNIQQIEDVFVNNIKNDKIISLSMNLINNNCKIIRAGKDLSLYKNNNLFDLFPLIFKEYQINLFLSNILNEFDINREKNNPDINSSAKETKKFNKVSTSNTNNIKVVKPISNKKNKLESVEIKVIICQNISSTIYYKLLTLKLIPLFNNSNKDFIIFDGVYILHSNIFITLQDFEENNNPNENLVAVSDPELGNSSEIYSMPIKKYIALQNNNGFNVLNISKFTLFAKLYNIYKITPKDKVIAKKKNEKKVNGSVEKKVENEDEIRRKKIEQIIEDNASVSSQQNATTFSNGISGLGMRNKKKDNAYEYSGLNRIKKIIYIMILIALIIPIYQFILLKSELNDTLNNNYNYLEFREIFQLYYQLFSSILGIACIKGNTDCKSLVSIFSDLYDFDQIDGFFDFKLLMRVQSQVLASKIMDKRTNLVNIHKNIGDKEYNEIFGQLVKYKRVTQTFINENILFNITSVNIQFSEAILIACNSFQILSNDTSNDPIFFLNKSENPFENLYIFGSNTELSKYQKELYEMILNYQIYRFQLNAINKRLSEILTEKSTLIQSTLYFYIYFNTILILIFASILYVYLFFFQNIIVKILNYINMVTNMKNDNFNFAEKFTQKIENLEGVLQVYNGEPVKAVQNLTSLYSKYQQYLSEKNKNNANDLYKKNYKKISNNENKKNEMDDVPKNQRIVNRNDIRNLYITFKYLLSIFITLLLIISSYIVLMITWEKYFLVNTNLYSLIKKNLSVEASLYKSKGAYELMVFRNFTLEEIALEIFYQYVVGDNDKASILRGFYKDVQNCFNGLKEKSEITNIYSDYGDEGNFTCKTFFEMNNENIEILKQNEGSQLGDIKDKLIKICENSRLTETNDIITSLQKHYQRTKNGILSITDFSYDGLINHINSGVLGQIIVFFNCILIYVLEVTNNKPHKKGVDNLMELFWRNILLTEGIYIGLDLFLIILSIFFFILNIKNYCDQLFLLKKIFKIFEIQEQ